MIIIIYLSLISIEEHQITLIPLVKCECGNKMPSTNNLPHTYKHPHTRRILRDLCGSTLPLTSTDKRKIAPPHSESFTDTRLHVFIANTNYGKLPN